jgi:23S rRNA (adenine2503-C2)-methyltransferase
VNVLPVNPVETSTAATQPAATQLAATQLAAIEPPSIAPLIGASAEELTQWIQSQGQPAYRGKQLHQWIYERGIHSLAEVSVFPKAWRETVANLNIGRSRIAYRAPSADGTVKFLLEMSDGQIIEAVGIPAYKNGSQTLDRLTVCVSSQVGCPMKCDFCATGKGGFTRNLERHEIVDQILTVQADFGHRVSNVVFMGMGEPLLNVETVVESVRSMNQDIGIGQRYITISTVGIPGQINRLADRHLQATLAVSLHASNQQVREQLIPSARQYPLSALLEECRNYVNTTGRRVTFEYIVLAGVNDHTEHAHELANLLKGFQSHVNLIPYNPISEVDYQRPSDRQLQVFMSTLKAKNVAVSVRRSRGLDANAACGQLRANQLQTV